MMLTSQPIKEGAAKKLGLVDDVVPKEKLLPAARQLALAIAAGKAPRSYTLYRTDKLESLGEALAIIDFAKAQAAKKGAHLTHPQLCLDAIRWGVEFGGLKGIDKVWACADEATAASHSRYSRRRCLCKRLRLVCITQCICQADFTLHCARCFPHHVGKASVLTRCT